MNLEKSKNFVRLNLTFGDTRESKMNGQLISAKFRIPVGIIAVVSWTTLTSSSSSSWLITPFIIKTMENALNSFLSLIFQALELEHSIQS